MSGKHLTVVIPVFLLVALAAVHFMPASAEPDDAYSMEVHPLASSTRRILETVFPGDKIHLRLPNLEFVKDNALNIANYGEFDVVFCSGLLYHFDKPKRFLETLSPVTKKFLILQTHFATRDANWLVLLPTLIRKILSGLEGKNQRVDRFYLSRLGQNEGLKGRWFTEFYGDRSFSKRETSKWASWDNRRSFWIQREYLLQAIKDVGFDLVLEQFDNLGPDIAASLVRGRYHLDSRGTFIGIKA